MEKHKKSTVKIIVEQSDEKISFADLVEDILAFEEKTGVNKPPSENSNIDKGE